MSLHQQGTSLQQGPSMIAPAKGAAHSVNPTSSTESQQTAGSPRRHGQHANDMPGPAQQNSSVNPGDPWSNTQPIDSPAELPGSENPSLAKLLIKQQLSSLNSSQLAELQQQLRQQRLQRAQESLNLPMMVPPAVAVALPMPNFGTLPSIQAAAAAAAGCQQHGPLASTTALTGVAAAVQAGMASGMLTGSSLGNAALQKTEDILLAASRALNILAGSSAAAHTASVGEQHQKPDFHYQQHPASQWNHLSQYINLQHLDSLVPVNPCIGPGGLAAAAATFVGSPAADPLSWLSNQPEAGGTAAKAATCFAQQEKVGSNEHAGLELQHPGIPGSRGSRSRGSRGKASATKVAAAAASALGHQCNVHNLQEQEHQRVGNCAFVADSLPTAGSDRSCGGGFKVRTDCVSRAVLQVAMLQETDGQSPQPQQHPQAQAQLMPAAAAGPGSVEPLPAAATDDIHHDPQQRQWVWTGLMREADACAASCQAQCQQSQQCNHPHHKQQQQRLPSPVIHLDSSSRAGSSDTPVSPQWKLPAAPGPAASAKRVRFELVAGGQGQMQEQQPHSKRGRTGDGRPAPLEDPYSQQQHLGMRDWEDLEQQEAVSADEAVGRRRLVVRRIGVRAQARKRMFKKATRRRRPQRSPLA